MHMTTQTNDQAHALEKDSWLQVSHSTDIDEHARSQPDWSLHYEQHSCGRFEGDLSHLQLPGMRLIHETLSCAVRQRGSIGEGNYGFAMTIQQPGEAIFNGQRLDNESIMIGRSEELDLSTPATFSMIGIVVDANLLNLLWERMYQKRPSSWIEHQVAVQARPGIAATLRETHLGVLERIRATAGILRDPMAILQVRDAILIEWIEAIPANVDTSGLKNIEARKRVVQRACETMLVQPDQPMSILQLCSLIGASPRKLEYCFQDILGTSPVKYLRTVRLNGVRRDLKRNTNIRAGVNDIATHWGFWHLGKFSSDYKRQFGEMPSDTLRRARAERH